MTKINKTTILIVLAISNFLFARQNSVDVPWQDNHSKAENLEISLITFSPGDYLTDWFGHTAIAVQDTFYNYARVYNFGLFSFDDGFINRFVMGRLIFWAGDASLGAIMSRYMKANRTISYQVLNIENDKKLELAKELANAVLPENSHYLYHHYEENCATRLRDLIDKAVDGQLYKSTQDPAEYTYREHTRRYTAQSPLMQWLLMFLMNDSIDKPIKQWDEMFLPDELAKYVGQLKLENNLPLVSRSFVYFDSHRPSIPGQTSQLPLWTIFTGLFLAGFTILLAVRVKQGKRLFNIIFMIYSAIITLVFGFIGSSLFFMSMFTDHLVTQGNENLLLANPVTLVVFFLTIASVFSRSKKLQRGIYYLWLGLAITSILAILLKIIPVFDQDNYMIIAVLLPVNAAFAAAYKIIQKTSDE
ncbi:MAG: DUF4105 domain-containing protein [Calditrichaeota bacterium]|nr:DUF4105 domain-containing protein [Calditrichota bacterium]